MTLASFEEILFIVSGMAMNGCLFLGELPAWLAETEFGTKVSFLYFHNSIYSYLNCFSLRYTCPVSWSLCCSLVQGNGWTIFL